MVAARLRSPSRRGYMSRCSLPGWTHSLVPSAQCSRFQIGTSCLSVSISHWPAAKASRAVRRADDDRHAGLGERHAAQAMDDDTFYQRPAAAGFGLQLGQLLLGHFAVGFVVERDGLPAGGQLARRAEEQHDRAGFRARRLSPAGRASRWVGR